MKMWNEVNFILTVSYIAFLVTALPSPKTINLPPGSPEALYLGCYEEQSNDLNIDRRNQNTLSVYHCIQACAHEAFPLAAVFNDTECQCANETISSLIKSGPCNASSTVRILHLYNATDFSLVDVELYQELTFVVTSLKVSASLTSSTSYVMFVTPSSASVKVSTPVLYSVDFGDRTQSTSWLEMSVYKHKYLTNGLFNVTVSASRGKVTLFFSSRTIRVLSPPQVTGMTCPAVKPNMLSTCTLQNLSGSGIVAFVTLNSSGQEHTVSVAVPDVPRTMLGEAGFPVTNQSDANNTTPGTYLLHSLQFTTNMVIEAWEVYADIPGQLQLQIFRAALNFTGCESDCRNQSFCGKLVPQSDAHCDEVCVRHNHCRHDLSCAQVLTNYTRVYQMDTNVTAGYNLIILPERERFQAQAGDMGGFHRNSLSAVVQRTAVTATRRDYFVPEQNTSASAVDLDLAIPQNTSSKVVVHGTVRVSAQLTLGCVGAVGAYHLTAVFTNAVVRGITNEELTVRSSIVAQSPITGIVFNRTHFIAVNTTKKIVATVQRGTNITCKWNTTSIVHHSAFLEPGDITEGNICELNFSSHSSGYFPIYLTVSNRVSRHRKIIYADVQIIIRGLKVHMCYSSFAYNKASTCFNANVTQGNKVDCTWRSGPSGYVGAKLETAVALRLTPPGNKSVTVYCHNAVSSPRVVYPVRVITNPVSIRGPQTAIADTQVKFTCTLKWPGGSPAAFFANQSVAGMLGTDISSSPSLVIIYREIQIRINDSSPAAYLSFRRRKNKQHKVLCRAQNYPDLNNFHVINVIDPVTSIKVIFQCPARVTVDSSCIFQVQVIQGDEPSYKWIISESGGQATYIQKIIKHRFTSPGFANVTVNVTNGYSSLVNRSHILVLSRSTSAASPERQSPLSGTLPSLVSSTPLPSLVSSTPLPSLVNSTPLPSLVSSTPLSSLLSSTPLPSLVSSTPLPSLVSSTPLSSRSAFNTLASSTISHQPLSMKATSFAMDSATSFLRISTASLLGFNTTDDSLSLNRMETASLGVTYMISPSQMTQSSSGEISSISHIPPLDGAKLRYASTGRVGQPIFFSVANVEDGRRFRFLWDWHDQTDAKEGNSSSTRAYPQPGQYFITVHILSSSIQISLSGHVTIQYPIAGLLVQSVAVGRLKVLHLEFEISQGTNVTYEVNYGDDSGNDMGFIHNLPAVVTVIHQFKGPGTYVLSIHVNSLVGPSTSIQQSISVSDASCAIQQVSLIGAGESRTTYTEIQQEYEFSFFSSLRINCSSYEELKYSWQLEKITNDSNLVETLSNDTKSSGVFFIAPSSLRAGLYKLTLIVTAIPQGASKSTTGYFRVRMPRLLAVIDCGSERTMSWGREVVIDASKSRDPNEVDANKDSGALTFQWFCNERRDVSCFKGKIINKAPVLRFPAYFLEVNKSYPFLVVVSEGPRHAEAKQTIMLVQDSFPSLCVSCTENCAHKLVKSRQLVLTSRGCNQRKGLTCTWDLFGPPTHIISRRSVSPPSVLISTSSSAEFVLDPSNLIPNETYTIALNDGSSASAKYWVTTDTSPSGGSCVVTPSEGKVIQTRFLITCAGWTDEDSPLWYEFFQSRSTLLSYSWMSYSQELFLPTGSPQNDFTLNLFAKISDVLGSYSIFPLQVKVRPLSPEDGSVSSFLKGIVTGPESMLERLLAAGEFQQASQLSTTVIALLNEDSQHSTTSATTEFRDRMEVRSRVIEVLSQVDCASPQCIRQTLGGLLETTKVSPELSPDSLNGTKLIFELHTQVNGAKLYTNMAEALVVKYQNQKARNESEAILHGITDVVEASLVTNNAVKREQQSDQINDWINDANEARNQDTLQKSEEAIRKSLEGVNYVAQKILDYQRKGAAPTHVTTRLITQTLSRQSPTDIMDEALDGEEVSFRLPWEVKRDKLGHLETVDSKIVTSRKSLFNPKNAINIDTPVSSLEFQEASGREIPIRDLAEPIDIFLAVNQSENKDRNNITGTAISGRNMAVFRIEPEEQSYLYFTIRCSGELNLAEKFILMGRNHLAPTDENADFHWNLDTCNTSVTKIVPRSYSNETHDRLYVGVKLAEAGNLTNTSKRSEVVYEVSVKAIGCYYWDEKMREWRTEGCKVGPLTTSSRIHCQCNHLTWFGGRVFVPPNKLHLDIIASRIRDPASYAAVLAMLCITFGLYILLIIWARRQDRKDILKTGTSVSPSNRPGDTHAYEVIICTGMRRHAGTTANVAIAITGELNESIAFVLKNCYRATLTRGSVDSFLITTSETLGPLSYIRVWHDNYGNDPAWYVKQVSVRKIDTGQVWHFLCDRWLAVDEGDGMVDRIFPVASNEELKEFRHLFLTKAYKDFTDSHLWFSVVWRPSQSPFTRVQRVSCCLSLLLCTMMANAMWYEADKGRYTAVKLGALQFSWEQVSIGICSSLAVFPVNLLLVQIFRHCRPAPSYGSCCFRSNKRRRFSLGETKKNNSTRPELAVDDCCPPGKYKCKDPMQNTSPLISDRQTVSSYSSLQSTTPRSVHLPSLSVSLATNISSNSTDDRHVLLPRQSGTEDFEIDGLREYATTNGKRLPWWFVFVGWTLVVLTSSTAATVTLLYAIEFGRTKSTQWLLSMLFSVTQDVFVSQPIKVVFFALIFAYIFKKPNTVISSSPLRINQKNLANHLQNPSYDFANRPVTSPVHVPSEKSIKEARNRAEKERAMCTILLDIGTFLVFLFLLLLIAYGFRDPDAFHQNEAIAKVLLTRTFSGLPKGHKPDKFSEISRKRDMWDWIENGLLPSLYNLPSYFYTGKAPRFVEGESGLVLGVARLRQHRIQKDSCEVVRQAKNAIAQCIGEYSITSEEEHSYSAGWKPDNRSMATKLPISPDPWRYSSSSDLQGYPYVGGISTYSGGGYVLELSHIYYKGVKQVRDMRSQLWVDRYTRSIFIEFTLYNPNSNLLCSAILLMEAPSTGGVFSRSEFLSYRLHRYVGDFQLFILACQFFFLAFVLYFTYRETKKLFKKRRKYFTDTWNLLDLAVLVLCWMTVAHYFICLGLRKWTIQLYRKDPTKFISFQYLSAWQLMFEGVLGVTVFVTCLKFIKLLRFNRRIFLLSYTLRQARGELLQYFIVFGINFLAFSQLYHFLLATNYHYFSSLAGSMQQLLSVLLGKFNFEEMMSAYKVLGALIFFLYMAITNFLLLNVLIVIVIDSFKVAKQENDLMRNEFELLEFVTEHMKDYLGVRSLRKPADPLLAYTNEPVLDGESNTWQTNETAEKLERSLDRLERYIKTVYENEVEDDILCCYVSRRINPQCSLEVRSADNCSGEKISCGKSSPLPVTGNLSEKF